jgi:hypothetical protein
VYVEAHRYRGKNREHAETTCSREQLDIVQALVNDAKEHDPSIKPALYHYRVAPDA